MEEKVSQKFSSVFRKHNLPLRFNLLRSLKLSKDIVGFTLIELLVVISMFSVLFSFLLLFINPSKQLDRAKDAQRIQNLKQVNTVLDSYYNDNNCYPDASSLTFGSSWQIGPTVYMKKIPQDPNCSAGGSCYTYVADPSTCPQWNVIFAKIYQSFVNAPSCTLQQFSNCVPSNYAQSGYNYCVLSGEVDCAYISSITLPENAGAPTVTPTPTDVPGCSKDYSCTGNPIRCNSSAPAGSGQYCNSSCDGNCP